MKQKIKAFLPISISLALIGCASPIDAQTDIQRETSLYDFERPSEVVLWKASPLASIHPATEWVSKGSQSARIEFQAWDPHQKAAPSPSAADAGDKEMLEPAPTPGAATGSVTAPLSFFQQSKRKLSSYDFLEFETHNPGTETVHFNFALTGERRSRSVPIELAAGQTRTVRVALRQPPFAEGSPLTDQIGRYLSAEDANGVSFNLPYSPRNITVYVDNLRLIVDPREELNLLSKQPAAPLQKIATLNQQIDSGITHLSWEKLELWREELAALQNEARKLRIEWNEEEAKKYAQSADFTLATESPLQKVFLEKSRFQSTFNQNKTQKIYAARNEAESFQAIIFPVGKELRNVSWKLGSLKNKAGQKIPATVRMVGYVETKQQPRYHVPFLGWWPDPLIDNANKLAKIPQDEVLPLWVTVEVPENAAPGNYASTLEVTANGMARQLKIDLEVWNFTLPARSSLPNIVQLTRLNSMSQFAPPKQPEETYEKRYARATRDYENWLLKYHIQPGNIYAGGPPEWDANRIKELVGRGLSVINLAYIRINRKEAETYNEAEYWQHVEQRIANVKRGIPVLKEAGVWDNPAVMLYINLFDEWPGKYIGIVYETAKKLKQEFPNVKLVTTAYDYSYGLGRPEADPIDIWIPSAHLLDANRMHIERAQAEGKHLWWYFAVGSYKPYPNFWLESPAGDARLLGTISYKYNVPGFMYWSVNRWFNNNPNLIRKEPRTGWDAQSFGSGVKNAAHGEGSLFYARRTNGGLGSRPLSSIRLENYRDGVEDYEYYVLLEKLHRASGISPVRVEVPEEVIRNIGEYNGEPAALETQRKNIAEQILRLQKLKVQ